MKRCQMISAGLLVCAMLACSGPSLLGATGVSDLRACPGCLVCDQFGWNSASGSVEIAYTAWTTHAWGMTSGERSLAGKKSTDPRAPGKASSCAEPPYADDVTAEQLAGYAQEGSLDAFAELVTRYHGRLFNFLLRKTGNWADAEELTQESFVRAWERIARYDNQWRFSTWLFTIGSRLAVSHHRSSRRVVSCDAFDRFADRCSDDDPTRRAMRGELRSPTWDLAARVLTDAQLTALWLRYAEDLSMKEIAQVLGKSQVSVRVTLFRARDQLAMHIAKLTEQAARVPIEDAPAGVESWVMEA